MFQSKTFLGLVTARGGSKGLPRKNVLPLSGKPLIGWTIDAARKSSYLDRLILSSDDAEIIETAQMLGCEAPFIRPAELARDESSSIEVVLHALDALSESYDYIVLLQPTSPLRSALDIDQCIEQCLGSAAPCCFSVTKIEKNPLWMFWRGEDGRLDPIVKGDSIPLRRQDGASAYGINGAIYVADVAWFRRVRSFISPQTTGFVMPAERSLDIDSREDFLRCEVALRDDVRSPENS